LSAHNVLQYDVTRADLPLMIGTWGPRLAALAGEVADEVKIGGCVNPAIVAVMRERIAIGARKAGRDVDAVGIVLGAVTVVDEDGAAARRRAKEEVALYLPTVAALDPTVAVDPELLARMEAAVRRGDRRAAAALISDDLLRPFAFAGSPADVIAHAEAIFAAGASRIEFGTPHGLTDARGVQLLGERVLPALR
jgi:5,10-methylenetetrahydromethanopterin reductase